MSPEGVTFVVPVYNGERWLVQVIDAILREAGTRPHEVLVVDDGSSDGSLALLSPYIAAGHVRLLIGRRKGATGAINDGIRAAQFPIICQIDQDVIIQPGWVDHLVAEMADPQVAAVQGYYTSDPTATLWARVMGFDLEYRYSQISTRFVDHACTGNTAYRTEALRRVGLFDEDMGYGYDNDMSYRLLAAGYRLVFCREARSIHQWRAGGFGYLKQQYGVGYGRLDVVIKHRHRYRGDDVSRLPMMMHAPLMLCVLIGLTLAACLAALDRHWQIPVASSAVLLLILAGERLIAGTHASFRFRTPLCLYFVPVHLLRDLAWGAAIVVWTGRRLGRRPMRPSDSM